MSDKIDSLKLAHQKAMVKFMNLWMKHPTGFDFTVPLYRRYKFEEAMKELLLSFRRIGDAYAKIHEERMSLLKRIMTGNFKRDNNLKMVGIGIKDLVREDFIELDGTVHNHRNTTCYSIAPTKKLLEEREARR